MLSLNHKEVFTRRQWTFQYRCTVKKCWEWNFEGNYIVDHKLCKCQVRDVAAFLVLSAAVGKPNLLRSEGNMVTKLITLCYSTKTTTNLVIYFLNRN